MRLLVDTFLKTYLWSFIEPATAIWCACLMTYRPLFVDVGLKLRIVFGGSKQALSNKKKLFNSKSSSSAWPSLGRNLHGKESAGYQDLSAKTGKGNLHIVNFYMKPAPLDRRTSPRLDDYERPKITVGTESSLV